MGFGMVLGTLIIGQLQDRLGPYAALTMLLIQNIVFGIAILIQNEHHVYHWTSFIIMFGWGMIDNTVWCFLNVACGFEFESKIVPFGAKLMVEMLVVFIVAGSLYLWGE